MAAMSNKEKTMKKTMDKMPMGMMGIAVDKKPISVEFMVKAEKKKVDGKEGVVYTCQRMDGPMDEPKNEHSSIDGLMGYLKTKLSGATKELGGSKSKEKEVEETEEY